MSRPATRREARTAKAAETRRRLIETAVALFSENDYDKVGVGDIADTADVAHGLLFHYFTNKRGIYLEAMRATAESMTAVFTDIPVATPDVAVRAALTAHLNYLRGHRGLALRLVLGGRGADPEAWQVFEDARTAALQAAAQLLGLQADRPAVRLVGRTAVAAIDEATVQWLHLDDDATDAMDVTDVVETLVHLVAGCLRAAPVLDPTVDVEPAVLALIGPAAPVDGDGTEA